MRGDTGSSGLFGRDVELAALRDSVARSARGDGHVVVVEGEAGIGKSALTRAGAAAAAREGFRILSSGGDEMARGRPFAPLLDALERDGPEGATASARVGALLQPAAPGARSLLSSSSGEHRQAVADALGGALAEVAQRGPALLVVEDLHWIDPPTTLALHAAQRRASGVPLLLVLTSRPAASDDAERELRRLTGSAGRWLRLGPLDELAVEQLVLAETGLPPGPILRGLLDGAGGNPLFVSELLHSLLAEGLTTEVDGTVEARDGLLPASFAERILDTVVDLEHDARGVLRLGAILGASFSLADLATVSGRPAGALADAVQSVLRAGLLGEAGDRLVFRHDLVRSVIYDALPRTVRAGVHRHVAVMLAAAGAPAVTVAEHFARGGQPGDAEAVTWLRRGAEEVRATAPEVAVALLERACELAGFGTPVRAALDVERLEAIALCGRLTETEELSAHLLHTIADPALRARARELRAGALLLLNRGADAGNELLTLAESVSGAEAVRALAEAAISFLAAGEAERAQEVALRARAAAADGTGIGHALALCVLSRHASLPLDFDASLELAQQAITVADRDGERDAHMYQPLLFAGMSLHDLDRLDEVLAQVSAGRAINVERGWDVSSAPYCALAAFAHLRAGRLGAAAAEAEAGAALTSRLAAAWCHALVALVALHRDEVASAQAAVAAGEAALAEGPLMLGLDLLLLARALVDEAGGQDAQAAASLHDAWAMFVDLGMLNMAGSLAPDVVRLAVARGEDSWARAATAFLTTAAERVQLPSWDAAAAVAQGLVARDPAHLLRGVELADRSPRALLAARAREDAGKALCDRGDTAAGRDLLRQSVTAFERCGATRDARRVGVALRAAGGRRRTPHTPRTTTALAGLSRAEHEVAALVAGGLTNAEVAARLFVSRRTVEAHLYRIYGKLGVRSRVELAVLAGQTSP